MDRELLRKALRLQICRQCFGAFVQHVQPGYLMGWVHERICAELDRFLADVVAKKSPRLMLTMPPRHGKLCADDTPVLTSEGWKSHGDLRCGDFVFHPSGKLVEVVAVGPKDFATHRVLLTNGDEIDVHLNHEWCIYDRPRQKYRVVETRFFVDPTIKTKKTRVLSNGVENKRGHRYHYQIDVAGALCFPRCDYVVPPYVLGVWLGDGTSVSPRINMSPEDAEIVKREFEQLGVPISCEWTHPQTGVVTFSFAGPKHKPRNSFSREMKDLSLICNKHIPHKYLYSDQASRLELLAGLIDTDGSYDAKHGRYRFITASKRLADDVAELVRLCGIACHVNKQKMDERDRKIKATCATYTVSFFPNFEIPCRLARKRNQGTSFRARMKRIGVKAVVPLDEPKQGNCIQVDSPDGMYLVGKHLTPTHNSTLASRCFPAYALGRYPDMSFIATSYNAALASRMNRDVQRIIDSPEYAELFPGTRLAGMDAGTSGTWQRNTEFFEVVDHKGVYRSAGVSGSCTGHGADIICCDDPVKDRAEADSPTISQGIWEWYTSTLYTRLAPGGGIIIIQTRWGDTDLSGRLLEAQAKGEGDEWRVINFPAIAEADEEHRKKGEALHPERYPLEALERIKQAIGTRDWEALYQQHPVPDGGAIFKDEWLQRTWLPKDLPAKFDALVIAFDMAFKGSESSDFVAGQLYGKHGPDFYLLDQERGHFSFVESLGAVRRLLARAQAYTRGAVRVLVEDKANGPAVIDVLKREIPGIVPVQPEGSKEARAHSVTPLFESGNVVLPDASVAPWVSDFRLELLRFPSGAHDDMVDSCVYCLRNLSAGHRLNIAPALQRQLQGFRFRR